MSLLNDLKNVLHHVTNTVSNDVVHPVGNAERSVLHALSASGHGQQSNIPRPNSNVFVHPNLSEAGTRPSPTMPHIPPTFNFSPNTGAQGQRGEGEFSLPIHSPPGVVDTPATSNMMMYPPLYRAVPSYTHYLLNQTNAARHGMSYVSPDVPKSPGIGA